MPTRKEVYDRIEEECAWQEKNFGFLDNLEACLTSMREQLNRASDLRAEAECHPLFLMHFLREIAATATLCMEKHGAPKRILFGDVIR